MESRKHEAWKKVKIEAPENIQNIIGVTHQK